VSFTWIRRNQFIFHLQVSHCTCGITDSYHINISIVNGKIQFDGTIEIDEAPKHRDDKFVFVMINNINVIFEKPKKGKKRKKTENAPKDSPFKK
jgi:hypothetical protein